MRLKELEGHLQQVAVFKKPSVSLEQYPTSPHIASHMLYTIDTVYEEIEDRVILDLGCGCGMLGIAACILGSAQTIGVDIDTAALDVARSNCAELDVDVDLVQADVDKLHFSRRGIVDTGRPSLVLFLMFRLMMLGL
eukprot:TRINITY_DN6692_c0_g1_i2.p2 TRINITY_DN6692_c0_g1~~TRINITY_DN6692_c0_g1_i2.p2  ORF type:complete len:137 (-),score=13.45 TRINITY_DN6692_c0_g1_i2:308-718(-)